jgi:hypothetical protein
MTMHTIERQAGCLDPAAYTAYDRPAMFGRLRCVFGRHGWVERLDGRETYTVCERCGHEKNLPRPPDIPTGRGSGDTG